MTNQVLSNKYLLELQDLLKYRFNNLNLLTQALSHPSVNGIADNKNTPNYERLEFLGDSLINFIISEQLFKEYKNADQGVLSKLRTTQICKDRLVKIASHLKIQNFIILSKGEESLGGRNNENNLENCVEAVLGAIYLDSDFNNTKKVVLELWNSLSDINLNNHDPKTKLQELGHKIGVLPIYELIEKTGPDHLPIYKVKIKLNSQSAIGEGTSKKIAEKNAAQKLLKQLN